ncbi:MAG TPA: hypothetical protein VFU89_08535 [Rhabdochlamydiaceae bacterium]|nr:hypothetical protein [Rhabdochlamydiaceae bacterium]
MAAKSLTQPKDFYSYVPHALRIDGPYGDYIKPVNAVYAFVLKFLKFNLDWLRETSGQKMLLIKLPDAIVSISKRIGPATHIPGRMINNIAHFLTPLHRLGGYASPLIGFAEVGYKFPAMFVPSKEKVPYVAEAEGKTYQASFPLNSWEQGANRVLSAADWTLSFTRCFWYLWRMNHTTDEKFPLAGVATWAGRYISLKELYFEGRFLYETLWVGPQFKAGNEREKESNAQTPMKLASVELVGSLLRLSLAVVYLSVDVFKVLATRQQSPWIETALFCASIAPTFINPLANHYWPKLVTQPLYNRS